MLNKFALLMLVVLFTIPVFADNGQAPDRTERFKTKMSFEPIFGYTGGYTKYRMEITGFLEDNLVTLISDLDFPLDGYMVGGKFNIDLAPKFRSSLEFATNIGDPHGSFIDRDWYTGNTEQPDGYFDGMFSYTESDVTLSTFSGAIKAYYTLGIENTKDFAVVAGYRYQKIDYEGIGYSGWQIPYDFDPNLRPIYLSNSSTKVIKYEITYKSPLVGILFNYKPNQSFLMDIEANYLYMTADDYDNHFLRGKEAVASDKGYGFEGSFDLKKMVRSNGLPKYSFGLNGSFLYSKVNSLQTQTWYQDEGEITAGTSIKGIPHVMSTLQYHLAVTIGIYIN